MILHKYWYDDQQSAIIIIVPSDLQHNPSRCGKTCCAKHKRCLMHTVVRMDHMHVHWTGCHNHACSTRLASLTWQGRPTHTHYCIIYSTQPRELGIRFLLQPTVTDTVLASSNTTRTDSLKRVLATVWSSKQLLFIWWTQQNTLRLLDQAMYTLICWSVLQSAPAYLFFMSSTQLSLPAAELHLLEIAINRALYCPWRQQESSSLLSSTPGVADCAGAQPSFLWDIKMMLLPSAPGCCLRLINPSVAELQTDPSLQSQTALQTSQPRVSSNIFLTGVPCIKHTDKSTVIGHMQTCNASIGMS